MSARFIPSISAATKNRSRLVVAIVGIFVLSSPAVATAQQYKTLKPEITVRQSKSMRGPAAQALRDPAAFQANKQVLNDYFKKFYFPQMTIPAQFGLLEKLRVGLFKQYIRPAKVPAAQKYLTELTLAEMQKIAQENFFPQARYNAVLILGMLDAKVAGTGAAATKPVPLPAASEALIELLEKDDINGVKVPPSIKLGALVGLERHARFGLDPKLVDRLTKAALAIATQEEPPADLDPDVHHWIRCQAARVLTRQYAGGPNAEVQNALASMIADSNMGLEDRCCVAGLLGKIKYDPALGIDLATSVNALGNLMEAVVIDEAKKAEDYQKEMLQGGVTRQIGQRPATYQRSQLVARLEAILTGASSIRNALQDAEKNKISDLLATATEVMEVAHDKNSEDLEVTPKVIELESQVRAIVESWKKDEAAPAGAKEADGEADFS